ncbi:MAG: gamma-glutamyltransferase, partial [Halobacteriaceae archaeon]
MELEYPWNYNSRRSAVQATQGMVATSHPLAAQAGLNVLQDGGSAADAAVTTAAVLNVVEPHMTGIGGDMFALIHHDGAITGLNGSGRAPEDADIDTYRQRTDAERDGEPVMPASGGLPVTVPGALDAWHRLLDRFGTRSLEAVVRPGALDGWHRLVNEYGRRELGELLAPAIMYAREGFPVSEYVATQWQRSEERLGRFDQAAETFLPGGTAPRSGELFQNRELAETLEIIANEGIQALYGGEIGADIVDTVQAHGGALRLEDLESHEGEWTDPISTTYRGLEVLEHPPNGQGTIALTALNIVEQFDLPDEIT